MTINTSGPISFQSLVNEFDDTTPPAISINEFYRGGANVPLNTAAGTGSFQGAPLTAISPVQIPTSGAIQLSQFYGTTKVTVTVFNSSGVYAAGGGQTVDVLVIGGGGGGGGPLENTLEGGGGGGGGGAILYRGVTVSGNITVTIGAGGAGAINSRGSNGGGSAFGIYSVGSGGGGGGGGGGNLNGQNGVNGGGSCGLGGGRAGGGITSPFFFWDDGAASFGNLGGRGGHYSPGGGGGGGFERGIGNSSDAQDNNKVETDGGNAASFNINGTTYFGGAGGGGGATEFNLAPGDGGVGGGGNGARTGQLNDYSGAPGLANTGGGGGGARPRAGSSIGTGGNGGSGRVVVYAAQSFPANTVYPTIQSAALASEVLVTGEAFADATISINSNGTITRTGGPNLQGGGETSWISTPAVGVGNSYFIRFQVTAAAGAQAVSHSTTPNVWYPLSSNYSFSASASSTNGLVQGGGAIIFVISTTASEVGRVSTGTLSVLARAEGQTGIPP